MQSALYLIAILGCGEGDLPCEPVARAEPRYESRDACLADMESQLMRHDDAPWPVVVAQCMREGEPLAPPRAGEVDLPAPETNPHYPVAGTDAGERASRLDG